MIRRECMRAVIACLLTLAVALSPRVATAQDAPPKRTQLSGRVVDAAGRPIAGSLVDIAGLGPPQGNGREPWIVATDSVGRFYFDSALVTAFIRVRSFGYIPHIKRLNLTAPKAAVMIKMIVDTSVANTCTSLCDLVYHRRTERQLSESQRRGREPSMSDSADIIAVYRAVLDSLLFIRGESPKLVVLPDSTFGGFSFCSRRPCEILPPHRSVIDSETLRAFDDDRHRRRASGEYRTPSFSYRVPIILQSEADRNELMRLGVALGQNGYAPGMYDVEGFWRSFRQVYPGAWGTTWLSRVDFNRVRDEALIHVMHVCGPNCRSAEIVYLRREPGGWHIQERIPTQVSEEGWNVAPLRYIGEGGTHAQQEIERANARRAARADSIRLWSAPRRVRGRVTHWKTGLPLENAVIAVHFGPADSIRLVRANARGEFVVRNPPIGPAMFETRCARARNGRHAGLIGFSHVVAAPSLYVAPGMDTTFDIRVRDIRACWDKFHYHKLDVAGEFVGRDSYASAVDADAAAVYEAALNEFKRVYGGAMLTVAARTAVACTATQDCDMRELHSLVAVEAVLAETVTAFAFANEASHPLPRIASPPHELLTLGERSFLLEQAVSRMTYGDAATYSAFWQGFRETHPGSPGIVTLSAIGFNQHRTEALVELRYEAANQHNCRGFVILKRKHRAWRSVLTCH